MINTKFSQTRYTFLMKLRCLRGLGAAFTDTEFRVMGLIGSVTVGFLERAVTRR